MSKSMARDMAYRQSLMKVYGEVWRQPWDNPKFCVNLRCGVE